MNFSMQTENSKYDQIECWIQTEAWPMSNSLAFMLTKEGGMLEIIFVKIESANYQNGNQGNWHLK